MYSELNNLEQCRTFPELDSQTFTIDTENSCIWSSFPLIGTLASNKCEGSFLFESQTGNFTKHYLTIILAFFSVQCFSVLATFLYCCKQRTKSANTQKWQKLIIIVELIADVPERRYRQPCCLIFLPKDFKKYKYLENTIF